MSNQDTLIHKGNLITLNREKVELREGGYTHFDIVKHPGGAVIAALNDNNEICLLKQWRHAVNKEIWEAPAGCLEPGEPPLETAKRELEEEAGVCASEWQDLGPIVTTPGFCNEVLHLFKAFQISEGTTNLDGPERLTAHWIPLEHAYALVVSGAIKDAKTLAILLKLKLRLGI